MCAAYVLIIVLNSSVQIFKDITILYRIVYDIEILLKAELNLRNNGVYRQNRIFYNAIYRSNVGQLPVYKTGRGMKFNGHRTK